ncbi:MAG: FAD-binding oxidoreductase [Rhodothermaceae bacterium]|nr:FAD-binding oxidoreductase [Rhodothermaceae bacterium]
MPASDYDAIILGGGISALTVALQLQMKGYAVVVIDKPAGSGAAGLPAGLANPAYGREAKKSWESEACIESLYRLSELADVRKNDWQEGWTQWLEPGEAAERFPLVQTKYGALWIQVGMTIDLPCLLTELRTKLNTMGSTLYSATTSDVYEGRNNHTVAADGRELRSPRIIFAPGSGIGDYPQWSSLKFNRVKGQVTAAAFSGFSDPGCSVASSGYAAFTGYNRVVVGSTYEHTWQNSSPSHETGRELIARFRNMCPQIGESLTHADNWAGIRLTTPDRKPCVGAHWEIRGFYCIAGMGSRGLLMAPLAAELIADHIHSNKKIPAQIDVTRFYRTRRFMNRT